MMDRPVPVSKLIGRAGLQRPGDIGFCLHDGIFERMTFCQMGGNCGG